ncbi:MAG: HAMP domain-containing histidine kinase [Bacteroidetes bacterium]|nr:HAMP domain-containing histidine kinase [Bacteroidota bacterium]
MRQYINWKSYLIVIALAIVTATLFYTNRLARNLGIEEKRRVEQVVAGIKAISNARPDQDVSFAGAIVDQNTTIPMIITDEGGKIIDSKNIDTRNVTDVQKLLKKKLEEFKADHPPIELDYQLGKNYIYYGESFLLTRLRYFPYVQLTIIVLFLLVVLIALSTAHRSMQNQVWVGLSKETAHQLGTPLSSIEAWMELLKEHSVNDEAVTEMQKDLDRLKLVADRFSKVGSSPQLVEENLVDRLQNMVDYMQKRAPQKVSISLQTNKKIIPVNISGPLFDWVIENLIRNALDAMAGKGAIEVRVLDQPHTVYIDVCDTGKGIPRHQVKKIFNPGYTTKKRGWGLGLSLSKRIVEKYHHGSLFVKHSEVDKGTTFRIILRR